MLLTGPAAPQAEPAAAPLTLEEAMGRARSQAREVDAATSRLASRRAELRQAQAHRWPLLQLQEVWIRTDSPAEAFALRLNQERFSFTDFVEGDPNRARAIDSAMTRFEVAVPLYTGGELTTRVRQAELAAESASSEVAWSADSAAFVAARSWIDLALAREQVALLERSLETVTAHAAFTRSHVEQGMLVSSELLRAQVEEARLADLLAEARGQARLAEAALSYRLAQDLDRRWHLGPLPDPSPLGADLAAWLGEATERSDLQAARSAVEAAGLEPRALRAAGRPRVGLVARYDFFDDRPFGRHGENSTVIAQASLDLFAGGRHRAAVAAAQARADAAAADLERFTEGVGLEVRQAWERAVTARERHATAQAALSAARETERIVEERFRQGVVKTLDVLDAATARREAETRELVSRAQAHLSALELATTAGYGPEGALPGGTGAASPAPGEAP